MYFYSALISAADEMFQAFARILRKFGDKGDSLFVGGIGRKSEILMEKRIDLAEARHDIADLFFAFGSENNAVAEVLIDISAVCKTAEHLADTRTGNAEMT